MKKPPPIGAILAFSPGVWGWPDFAGSPRYHLWTMAERGWPVLYVEPPVRWRWKRKFWSAPDRPFHVLSPGRTPPFQFRAAPSESMAEGWRNLTAGRLWQEAQTGLSSLGISPTTCWLGAPWHEPLAIRAAAMGLPVMTHTYDELPASPALKLWQGALLWRWESALLRRTAVAFCSSEPQRARREGVAPRAVLLENAVSDAFLAEAPAHDVAAVGPHLGDAPHPRFLYGGVVDHRLDARLFEALAADLRGGSLIFAGVADRSFPEAVRARLAAMPGVRFLGRVVYRDWPAIFAEADVLILGHRRSPFTDAMYPEKTNEYLASGKPVVAVPLPEVQRLSAEAGDPAVLRLADAENFTAIAHEAAKDQDTNRREARKALARRRSWDAVGDVLERELRAISPDGRG